ncbi:MAG: hypothetical protein QF492_04065 [Candidatus Krumholzibacteria bacterium]|jgi:Na+-driven multidrug efflux pump|nr:hypothetical protein [Candidatus Krumholzibacteria bacterium]MDP6669072.1 hypothetical protein [Candidatus Krumholzibacteria bacterium]MDP6797180.1 hypothetical protein [Candidatus Krumholzibacteria bacterium]MDP7021475.1 hypothetical protein [Candidatus Krumholzibacteria bacterium]
MSKLGFRQIFDFYWPLVLTSQMMTLAGPLINMALGRSGDAKLHLAAYAVGFGMLIFLNASLFPFQSTVAKLAVGAESRSSLLKKGLQMAGILFLVELALGFVPASERLISTLMGSTPEVSALARQVILVQVPIILLLPVRSFFYGTIMRHRNTKIISLSTGLRLSTLSIVVFALVGYSFLPAAVAGASSLTIGIAVETLYAGFRARKLIREDARGINEGEDRAISWRSFFAFQGPLMVNAVTWSSMRPVMNAIVGRCEDPTLAQAGYGFVLPLLILMSSPLWAFQSTTLVLVKSRNDFGKMMRFGALAMLAFSLSIVLVAWTPLLRPVLEKVFFLSPSMLAYVLPAILLIPLQPWILGTRSICQGLLMNQGSTGMIALASLLKLALVMGIGFPLVLANPQINGAVLGTILLMGAELVETVLVSGKAQLLMRA